MPIVRPSTLTLISLGLRLLDIAVLAVLNRGLARIICLLRCLDRGLGRFREAAVGVRLRLLNLEFGFAAVSDDQRLRECRRRISLAVEMPEYPSHPEG